MRSTTRPSSSSSCLFVGTGLALALAALPFAVWADPGTAGAMVSFSAQKEAFPGFGFDSGFLPYGSPIQVRLTFNLGGGFSAQAQGEVNPGVDDPVDVILKGIDGSGKYLMNIGVELHTYVRLHFSVLGHDVDWEGEIPIDNLPLNVDLRFNDEASFDPFLLDGQKVTVSDTIDPTRLVTIPITQALIPVPGIGGNLVVDVQGQLSSDFLGQSATAIKATRNGSTLTSEAHYTAKSHNTGTLHFQPGLEITFLTFSKTIHLDLPVSLPSVDLDWDLGTVPVTLEVPVAPSGTTHNGEPAGSGGAGGQDTGGAGGPPAGGSRDGSSTAAGAAKGCSLVGASGSARSGSAFGRLFLALALAGLVLTARRRSG